MLTPTSSAQRSSTPGPRSGNPLNTTSVTAIAGGLIVAALVIRGWVAVTGNFYWDDLILIGRASTNPILSWTYLGHSHDGHFMPGAFLVAGISTVIAPVNWMVPAVTLIVLQAIASVSVWRMIRVIVEGASSRNIAGVRVGALAALVFYLFTPMTVPAFAWWAAGLNSLPLQAAMAWIVADAVLATRDDRDPARVRTMAIRSSVIFLVALTFFEKSLFILPVAFVAAVLAARWGRRDGVSPIVDVFVRARALWVGPAVIFVIWLIVFFSVSDATAGAHSVTQTMRLVWRSINNAIVPSLVGGPWEWSRWTPSPPMGFAPVWMIALGWVIVAAIVVVAYLRRRGAMAVLLCTAVYAVLAQIPAMWNRSSANTALELAQTMRYLPDTAVVFTLAAALLIAAPARGDDADAVEPTRGARHREHTEKSVPPVVVGVAVLTAIAAASSLIAVAGFSSSWRDDPTGPYLATAKKSLAANRDHPMFDQSLPLEVLLPVAFPQNQISHTFGRVRDRPAFGDHTDRLTVLDASGAAVPGGVTQRRAIRPGRGTCARPEVGGTAAPTRLALDGPLLRWQWTIALSYCANQAGTAEFALDDGQPVQVPIEAGLHVIYVQLDGRGTDISLRVRTPDLRLHTGEGRVGEVVEARFLR